jgi:hemoglobin
MGRDMKLSHMGMGITEAEWGIFITHVAAALDAVGIAAREKAEFLQCTDGLKWDIVEALVPAAQ